MSRSKRNVKGHTKVKQAGGTKVDMTNRLHPPRGPNKGRMKGTGRGGKRGPSKTGSTKGAGTRGGYRRMGV